MKLVKFIRSSGLVLISGLVFALGVFAQEAVQNPSAEVSPTPQKRERVAKTDDAKTENNNQVSPETKTETTGGAAQTAPQQDDKRQESPSEEEASILPYYNNYLKNYRLGPEDIISVEVFAQCPNYCKTGISIPPTAKISYPLIREGVFVGGKTVEEVAEEITKKLDEYIIDPKVTVTLERVGSARYSVLGKVATPGVRLMTRRVSVYEAIVESGGVLKNGDRKRVMIYRQSEKGLTQIPVDLQSIERGKAEMIYLVPGDQVFIPDAGFKLSVSNVFKVLEKASLVRILFGSPF
ncbi:MAG TPA: polysaccharide biosynthesis/export family protein [Pyrinomonadaceae bacterium]|nr:polysaccharide biosynthesis/export family protein [Pyrinomonadaceae bacterium]